MNIKTMIGVGILLALGVAALALGQSHVADAGVITAMAVVQSAYGENMAAGVAGMVADESNWDGDTLNCETAAGIGFGLAVGQGTASKGGVLGGALAEFRGVSIRDVTLDNDTADEYAENQNMGVLYRGDIWVSPSVAVAVTDVVHYDATTGRFAISGGSGPIVGARWMTACDADGLAVLRLSGHVPVP